MHSNLTKYCAFGVGTVALIAAAQAQSPALRPLGVGLEDIGYPYPVNFFELTIEGQVPRIAYMDVAPTDLQTGKVSYSCMAKAFQANIGNPRSPSFQPIVFASLCRTNSASANPPNLIFAIALIFSRATPRCSLIMLA